MMIQKTLVLGLPLLVLLSSCAHRGLGPRAIDVSGQCFREVEPNRAQIDLTHVVLEKDVETATRVAAERYSKLKAEIEKLTLKDLEMKTLHYSVQERRDWVKDRQVSRGFEARMTLQVSSSDIVRLGETLSVAGREGVQEVGALRSFITTAAREKERGECLNQAVQDASRKAEGMARSLNARVGRVLRITEDGAHPMRPMPRVEAMADMAGMPMMKSMHGATPQLEGGKEELNYSVSVSFEIR